MGAAAVRRKGSFSTIWVPRDAPPSPALPLSSGEGNSAVSRVVERSDQEVRVADLEGLLPRRVDRPAAGCHTRATPDDCFTRARMVLVALPSAVPCDESAVTFTTALAVFPAR